MKPTHASIYCTVKGGGQHVCSDLTPNLLFCLQNEIRVGTHGMANCRLSPTKIQKPYFVIESFVGLAIRGSHQDT